MIDMFRSFYEVKPTEEELAALDRGSWEDRETILRLFEVVQWSQQGFVELNTPNCPMTSLTDQVSRVRGAIRAGIPLWQIPSHPHDYTCTVRELYEGIVNPRWRAAALKGEKFVYREGVDVSTSFSTSDIEAILPEPIGPEAMAKPALWGNGWFGSRVPGYFGLPATLFRGVPVETLEAYRQRGYSDSAHARVKDDAKLRVPRKGRKTKRLGLFDEVDVPLEWYVQFKMDPREGVYRCAVAPPRECLDIIDPGEREMWAIEEAAANGDFLAHCQIRALFVGVAKARIGDNIPDADLVALARRQPVPSLMAHIRIWRHADGGPAPTHSERMFMQEGFIPDCIERGKAVLREQGGLKRPSDFPHGMPLELTIGEVPVKIMMGMLAVDERVIDVIGLDAMDGACAKAKEELESFGIQLPTVHIDPALFAPPAEPTAPLRLRLRRGRDRAPKPRELDLFISRWLKRSSTMKSPATCAGQDGGRQREPSTKTWILDLGFPQSGIRVEDDTTLTAWGGGGRLPSASPRFSCTAQSGAGMNEPPILIATECLHARHWVAIKPQGGNHGNLQRYRRAGGTVGRDEPRHRARALRGARVVNERLR